MQEVTSGWRTLTTGLPMEAVQDLLILFRLVIELFEVCSPVVCILGQHQLDVPAEGQVLRKKEQHFGKHVGAEAAVSIYVGKAGRRKRALKINDTANMERTGDQLKAPYVRHQT